MMFERSRIRLALDALTIVGAVVAVYYWWLLTTTTLSSPVDSAWYWHADPANLYPHPELAHGNGYNYSPAFEFIMAPLRLLPFDVFVALWRGLILAALVWLAGPFTLLALLTVPVASEVNAANIQILLAAAIVAGFRFPATWAFVLLTKVTPGIGLVWFALRREWRFLLIAFGSTAVILGVSFVLMPRAWADWLGFITSGQTPAGPPYPWTLWQRLPLALVIVAVGAWRGWRWTVVVSSTIALPVLYVISPSMLVGVLPFVREKIDALVAAHDARGVVRDPRPNAMEQPSAD